MSVRPSSISSSLPIFDHDGEADAQPASGALESADAGGRLSRRPSDLRASHGTVQSVRSVGGHEKLPTGDHVAAHGLGSRSGHRRACLLSTIGHPPREQLGGDHCVDVGAEHICYPPRACTLPCEDCQQHPRRSADRGLYRRCIEHATSRGWWPGARTTSSANLRRRMERTSAGSTMSGPLRGQRIGPPAGTPPGRPWAILLTARGHFPLAADTARAWRTT